MRRQKSPQLSIQFVEDPPRLTGQFTVTRTLLKHRLCNNLLRKIHYVRRYFPELEGRKIKVGITHAASGIAVAGGNEVWFNPTLISYHTIAHEFVHLLQGTDNIPAGERSCDLFAMARHWTLNDTPPYYIKIPVRHVDAKGHLRPESARMICALAKHAIDLRSNGTRNYIAFFVKALANASVSLEWVGGKTDLQMDELFVTPG